MYSFVAIEFLISAEPVRCVVSGKGAIGRTRLHKSLFNQTDGSYMHLDPFAEKSLNRTIQHKSFGTDCTEKSLRVCIFLIMIMKTTSIV